MSDDRSRAQHPPRQAHVPHPNNPPRHTSQFAYTQPPYYTPPLNAQSFPHDEYRHSPANPAYTVPFAPQTPPGGVMYSQTGPYVAQYTSAAQHPSSTVQPHPYVFQQPFHSHQLPPPSPDSGAFHQPMLGIPYSSGSPVQQMYAYQQPSPEVYDSLQIAMNAHVPPRMSTSQSAHSESSSSAQTNPIDLSDAKPPTARYSNPPTSPSFPYSSQPYQQQQHPSMYQAPYVSPFQQSFYSQGPSEDQKGTWWYVPSNVDAISAGLYRSYDAAGFSLHPPSIPSQPETYPSFSHHVGIPEPQSSSPSGAHSSSKSSATTSDITMGISSFSLSAPALPYREVKDAHIPPFHPNAQQRKPYHPNPPANRSAWVMWVGNVPSDSTNDELWQFFNQTIPSADPESGDAPSGPHPGGVSSVFLISRSNCGFVNFESEQHLMTAVRYFNGRSLRPNDPRCMKLVCRVRKADDDLKAGVGGQRGMGMHTRYVKERKQKEKSTTLNDDAGEAGIEGSTSPTSQANRSISSDLSHSSATEDKGALHHSSSSGSYASTTSSFLMKHFPKRYFILKSLNEADLNLSVERGIWATQAHNEPVLDQAYQSSKEVYLIFSANKSGEFFGYAMMTGPIRPGERSVSWASRSEGPADPTTSQSRSQLSESIVEELSVAKVEGPAPSLLLSPSEHRLANSPGILTAQEEQRLKSLSISSPPLKESNSSPNPPAVPSNTAPPEMEKAHDKLSFKDENVKYGTFDLGALQPTVGHSFSLDGGKLVRAQTVSPHATALEQEHIGSSSRDQVMDSFGVLHKDTLPSAQEKKERSGEDSKDPVGTVLEQAQRGTSQDDHEESWGNPFSIRWIRTEKLSFHRTRHIRNPWNHDREVKVSRDGTELEPTIGAALLNEWDKLESHSPPPAPKSLVLGEEQT